MKCMDAEGSGRTIFTDIKYKVLCDIARDPAGHAPHQICTVSDIT